MGLFSWKSSKSNDSSDGYTNLSFWVSKPSPKVGENQLLQIPAARNALDIIASSISQLPLYLYKETDGVVEKVQDRRANLFTASANRYDTAQSIKYKLVSDMLMRGRAYLYYRDGAVIHLPAKDVEEIDKTADGFTIHHKEFKYAGLRYVDLDESEIISIYMGNGNGVLFDGSPTILNALAMQEYQSSVLENGALPIGLIKAAGRMTQPIIDKLRASWDVMYSGTKKAGRTIILEEGMDYQPLSLSPDKLQFDATTKQIVSQIAQMFSIPESMINPQANKYASLEQNSISFLQNTLSPIITQIEATLDFRLLSDNEKQQGYFFRFDTSELLRVTESEKVNLVASMWKDGIISLSEARAKLDYDEPTTDYKLLSIGNVIEFTDGKLLNLNMIGSNETTKGENNQNENGIT